MEMYKIKLGIHASIMTPFQADTLFGHLCWVVAHREGEKGLQEFFEPFQKKSPPFLISDGFPTGLLPKPLSAEFCVRDPQERKDLKKTDFVASKDFESIREGKECRPDILPNPYFVYLLPHNKIDRLTYSTSKEGGVFSLRQIYISEINIYLKVISEEWKNKVVGLLEDLSKVGYGKKKSIGIGHFSLLEVSEFSFVNVEKADGFVSLSNFCPAEDDPTEGLYKTFVKYGKLGEEFTFCGNPFKRPLVMVRAGSVFKTEGSPKEYYGRMIREGIAPAKPEVVQYAYSFAVPAVYPRRT
jgi:CRISPR-associated protein Csm4